MIPWRIGRDALLKNKKKLNKFLISSKHPKRNEPKKKKKSTWHTPFPLGLF